MGSFGRFPPFPIKDLLGKTVGSLSDIDYEKELKLWELVIEATKRGLLCSAKDISSGGLAIALAKMSAVSGLGVVANIKLKDNRGIFDESQSRAILEVNSEENLETVTNMAKKVGLKIETIGKVKRNIFRVNDIEMELKKLQDIYFNTFDFSQKP